MGDAQDLHFGCCALRFDTLRASVKGSHAHADLKKLYAAERGCPLRTAQYHAKTSHPDWVAFLARTGSKAISAPEPTKPQKQALLTVMQTAAGVADAEHLAAAACAPAAMEIPPHLRTPEQYAECEAWQALVLANTARNELLKKQDPLGAVAFVNIASNALKGYHLARAKRVAADIEAGRLKPMAAWQATKAGLMKIVALLSGLEGELAQSANPENPLLARKAIGDWKERKWNPAVEALTQELTMALGRAA